MNKILVATDYSPAAQNAINYAAHLAQHQNAALELLHAYIIPFAYTDSPVPLLNIDEIQKIAEDSMETTLTRLRSEFPQLEISSRILPGDLIDCLSEITENDPPKLIILGKSGSGNSNFFWGSMAVSALRHLKTPVLAVPAATAWKEVKKIAFAADYHQFNEQTPIREILNWTKNMQAALEVLHVDKPGAETEVPELLKQELSAATPVYHSILSDNLEDIIADFVTENRVDWLVVIPKKYGFFENIFHKSRTKGLTQASNVPVLALHQE